MDFLIFKAPMLMVQASLDGILLGILFALIAINANKIPRRIPSNEAWTINIGALKIRKSIKFVKLIKEKPLEN